MLLRNATVSFLVLLAAGCRGNNNTSGVKELDPNAAPEAPAAPTDGAPTDAAPTDSTASADHLVPPECVGFAEVPAGTDPLVWLTHNSNQQALEKIFVCAPAATKVPTGLGVGRGTLYQKWPAFNDVQTKLGTYIWGGKRLYDQGNGEVCLLNQMADLKTERYMAHVYLTPSNRDGKNTVVLDYRVDDTKGHTLSPVQLIIDKIAHGIRDEIREVVQNGVGTGVFLGRANLHKNAFVGKSLVGITDAEFADPTKYAFGANFFLDFRPDPSVKPYGNKTPTCVGAPTN